MRHQIITSILLASSCLSFQSVFAEDNILEPIIVTATRTSQTADESLAPVTVITRSDIENSASKSLLELLTGLPGIDINKRGGYGKASSLFMRGSSSDHTLILIDGIKIHSATTGQTALQHIPITQIERVEIVRGSRSSLYGSEAIGGVIQIFTRNPEDKKHANFNISYGSHDTSEISAGASKKSEKLNYSIQASQFNTEGIDAKEAISEDKDGYDNYSISVNVGYEFSKSIKLDITTLNIDGTNEFDDCSIFFPAFVSNSKSGNCEANTRQQVINSKLGFIVNDKWDGHLSIGTTTDESKNFREDMPNNTFITDHQYMIFQNNFQSNKNNLFTIGLDYKNDEVDSTNFNNTAEDERDNRAVFSQWLGTFNNNNFAISLRNDNNEQFGSHTTGNIDIGHKFSNGINLIVSASSAFKAPTFNELYFPFFGSPNTKPEESTSYELALKQQVGWGKWEINLYHTDIDDLIVFDSTTSLAGNIDKASIDGIETTLEASLFDWNTKFFTSFIDPRDNTGANKDNVLARRAKQTARIDINRDFNKFFIGASVLAQSHRYDDSKNNIRLNGYSVTNLKLGYQVDKEMNLSLTLDNTFDKKYQTVNNFNTLDRTIFISLDYTIK